MLIVLQAARRDMQAAHDWYEQRQPGLGASFLDDVEAVLVRIADGPLRYMEVRKTVRRALTHRFPYAVYYRLRGPQVRVIAVLHQRRGPGALRRHL